MEHFLDPRRAGSLPAHSGEGWSGSREAGRYTCVQVLVEEGRVQAARFRTYGCAPAIAAADLACQWAEGRTVEETLALSPEHLEEMLGGLPPRRRFCAALAVQALHRALGEPCS
jgi:nitrogen fixation NifU-like protein